LQKTKKELFPLCTPFERVIDMQFRVSEEIQRMIVDEIDRKKKTKSQEQKEEENEDNQMEAIKEERQEDDLVNTAGLEHAREKIENEIGVLSKVVGKEIGPAQNQHLYLHK
jgi:hypothetical protein